MLQLTDAAMTVVVATCGRGGEEEWLGGGAEEGEGGGGVREDGGGIGEDGVLLESV